MSRDKWNGRLHSAQPRGRVQVEAMVREGGLTLPEHVLRLAQTEYERQYGTSQDYERMQERAGLGILEVVGLLADYVERLGGVPTDPRPHNGSGGGQ